MQQQWSLSYEGYEPEKEGLREALCTLGNGYFASRGAAPDAAAGGNHYPGTYLAGGYNRRVSEISGRDIENEDLVNLPNWLPLSFSIDDGPWFSMDEVEILSYRQDLDLRAGVLHRRLRFRDDAGRTTCWDERRLVSMASCHLAALSVRLSAEDWSGELTVRSMLDGGVINDGVARYRELESRHLETVAAEAWRDDGMFLQSRMTQSEIHVAMAAHTRLYRDGHRLEAECETEPQDDRVVHYLRCRMQQGDRVDVEKVVALYTSRDHAISEPGLEARKTAGEAGRFDALLARHGLAWSQLWDEFDIELEERDGFETTRKLRAYVFHLLQTVSPHTVELDTGVPARGWHGEAYRGHIFWDELFIFPTFNTRMPMLTRALLRYRYRRLTEARRAAREAGYAGAMFPWQSGSNGREESQKLHLNPKSGRWIPDNTHRQRHINSAIAYNVWQYYQVTEDHDFMHSYGIEMLIEIARFWVSIAEYDERTDRYSICGVVGPDEYHTGYPDADEERGIDNNAYTNVMAAWVLDRTQDALELLPAAQRRQLCERIGLSLDEVEHWTDIARKLRVPFHGDGIISQFEGYESLEELDWEHYRRKYGDIQRMDRILEAEDDTPNRYKLSKQADVLMLFFLFSSDELGLLFEQLGYPFDPDTIPRNIEYYLARTSHGSTLSRVAHSWVLARSDRPRSWHLFQRALDSDLADIQGGTTPEGIHTGAMAGTVDLVQRGFVGIETRGNVLHFNPALPNELKRMRLRVCYRRQVLELDVDHSVLRITSLPVTAPLITIAYRGHFRNVAPGDTYEFRLLRPEERDRDENRTGRPPVREDGSASQRDEDGKRQRDDDDTGQRDARTASEREETVR